MRNLILIAIAVTSQIGVAVAGIYSWTDESGNQMYGDTPPENVAATVIAPPKLTILEGFATRYKDTSNPEFETSEGPLAKTNTSSEESIYTEIKVIAPKSGQAIRANDGDVSVALSLSPKLRSGDQIVIALDGKEISRGSSRVANLTNLDRGDHSLEVSVVNRTAKTLVTSGVMTFTVLRNSALINKPYNPYPEN